jgi:hypothetical protein
MNKRILLAMAVLMLVTLACGSTAPRTPIVLYPSPTVDATQTPIYLQVPVEVTKVVELTTVVEVTATARAETLCVQASEAVYLRPSPSDDNYPIVALPNGAQLVDLGGRDGSWYFVQLGDRSGWVNSNYLAAAC